MGAAEFSGLTHRGSWRDGVMAVPESIQSGTLFSVEALARIGGFDESLVIDGVDTDARNAVAAATEMLECLAELNQRWVAAGSAPFEIGIGLNHGEVIFAMMGSEQKQEMTVIGDPVNQAARLESLTKKFGQGIIVGEQVARYLEGQFLLRSLGKVRTMGKEEAEELAGVLGEAGAELAEGEPEWLVTYPEALAAFQAGDLQQAEGSFRGCLDQRPGDLTCAMYLDSIARGDRGGVLVMTGK